MLNNSFIQIPGIGITNEKRIWDCGVTTLQEFLVKPPEYMSVSTQNRITDHVRLSKAHLDDANPVYFYENLPSREHWRIFKEFQSSTAYLDIETTGLSAGDDIITTISLYDGKDIKVYVNGENLSDFKRDIFDYAVLVTYYGKSFDVPFIERFFNIKLPHAHLDLCNILHSLGHFGGLKSCEKQLNIGRSGILAEIDGLFAVYLWEEYTNRGNYKALESLLSYNVEDVINLEYLMTYAYNQKLRSIPLAIEELIIPQKPQNPFSIDASTVLRLQGQYSY